MRVHFCICSNISYLQHVITCQGQAVAQRLPVADMPHHLPQSESMFAELPEALVQEMLSHYGELGQQMKQALEDIDSKREEIRSVLNSLNLLHNDASMIRQLSSPTTCGIDGSRAIERLMSADIVAVAGLAIEGLTPPAETRLHEQPDHRCSIFTVNHHDSTSIVAEAIMFAMELELAIQAPHDVILLDGSLETPLIKFNLAFSKLSQVPQKLADEFNANIFDALKNYREILLSQRSDKIYAGVPKYTSRAVVASMIGMPQYEDRGMLSMVLNSGEIVGPVTLLKPSEPADLNPRKPELYEIAKEIESLVRGLQVVYYRPSEFFPALRIEVPTSVGSNHNRLSVLLDAIRLQSNAPGIMEPYPLYMADRMVKHLSKGLPALRRATTQEIASSTTRDVGSVYRAMHGYRTEYGR